MTSSSSSSSSSGIPSSSSGFDHLVNSLANSLATKGSVRASIGGKLYDVSIVNASPEQIAKLAGEVAQFVSGIDLDQLEHSRIFSQVRQQNEKIVSLTLKKANKAESFGGTTEIIVNTVDNKQKKKNAYRLYTGGKGGDKELSTFSLPKAVKGVKEVQIQLTPARTTTISFAVLSRELAKISQGLKAGGKVNFEVIAGPIAHVLDHTKVTLEDKEGINQLVKELEELKTLYVGKKMPTEQVKYLETQISTLNSFVRELEEFAKLKDHMAETADGAEAKLLQNKEKNDYYVIWPAEEPGEVNISYQVPDKESIISTKSSLIGLRKTLKLIKSESDYPTGKPSFSTGQPIRRSLLSRSDLASTQVGTPRSSLQNQSLSVPSSPSSPSPSPSLWERTSSSAFHIERAGSRLFSISEDSIISPDQERALQKMERFGSRANDQADASAQLTERPQAWIFWADTKHQDRIKFACRGKDEVVVIELDAIEVAAPHFTAEKLVTLLKRQPAEIRDKLNMSEIEMKANALKQI
jgi:hypothetical protein